MRVMKLSSAVILVFAICAAASGACSSDTKGGGDASAGSSGGGTSGSAGTSGGAGTSGSAGTSGNAGATGSAGRGGTTGSAGATGAGGAATGTQPIGAACANTSNCSQADGTAVCCVQISTCVIDTQCPSGTNYVPCTDTASCNKGGWICCNAGGMHFCTKQSGCP